MLSAWCIPCPDHMIVEHDQVAPLGPTPGECKFACGVGISLLRNNETWKNDEQMDVGPVDATNLQLLRNVLQEHDNFIVPWC